MIIFQIVEGLKISSFIIWVVYFIDLISIGLLYVLSLKDE